MKRKLKSALSLLLCMIMVFGAVAVGGEGIKLPSIKGLFGSEAQAASEKYDIYTYEVGTDGTVTITDCDGSAQGAITIPSQIDGKPVASIDNHAFMDCSNIASITIPDSVTSIGDRAFSGCTALTSLTLPSKIASLGSYFIRNTAITSITIPNTLTNAGWAFSGSNVKTVVFNDGIKSILNYMFQDDTALTTVTIPDSVTSIGSQAFLDCTALAGITIPDSVTSIGDRAFSGCTRLKKLYLPDSVTNFGYNVFYNSNNTVVECKEYSFTSIYCIDNNIPVEFISASFDDDSNLLLDRTNTGYVANTVSSLSNGYISLNVDYRFKSGLTGITPQKVFIYIPSSMELIESSLKLDGKLLTKYEYDDNLLEIFVSNNTGSISYSLKPTKDSVLTSYAYITFKKGNNSNKEVIGIINESIPLITIESSEYTSDDSVEVKGVAPAETEVSLFVDGKKQKTVKSNKAGIYSGAVTISDVSDYKAYSIKAQALNSEGETISSEKEVTYLAAAPELKTLTMNYNNHNDTSYELYPKNSGTPIITFNPNYPFKFTAEIENPESVNGVYITSTRSNVTKYMKAEYDESSGKYIASGYFDETNKGYVPGKIGVSYDLKHEEVTVGENVDWDKLVAAVPKKLTKDQVAVQTNTEKEIKATIDWSSIDSSLREEASDLLISVLEETSKSKINDIIGLYSEFSSLPLSGENAEKYEVYVKNKSGEPLEGFTYLVHDIATSKWVKMAVDFHDNGKMNNPAEQISESLSKIGTVTSLLKMVYKTYGIEKDCDELRKKVMSEVDINKQAESLKKIDAFEDDQINFMLVTTTLPLLVTSLGIATGPAGLVFSALLGAMTATSGLFWQYRTADILGESVSIKWKVDPSGYVYDIDTNERLSGVKATLYFVSYDESDENTKPADTNYGTLWNASEWDQVNPIMTDANGCYAWDVPEGWWRVKYEKENYITAWSDWLPVPPEQTDVNVGLRSTLSNVKTVTWIVDGVSTTETYKVGEKISKPTNPSKSGYTFKGWSPAVPATMPAYNMTFTAVFELTEPKISIKSPSTTTVSYGFTLNLHANVTDLPEGARVVWSMDGSGFELSPSADGMTCGVKSVSKGSATITAKVVDKNGNPVKDANGNEITASQQLTSKAGFFQKLVAFFKKLFGSNMVIPYALEWIIK